MEKLHYSERKLEGGRLCVQKMIDCIILSFRHLACRVRVTVQRSRKSWRTCVRHRRRWRNRERKERRRFDAVGSCHSVPTLSAEATVLYTCSSSGSSCRTLYILYCSAMLSTCTAAEQQFHELANYDASSSCSFWFFCRYVFPPDILFNFNLNHFN